jgi:monoamine oxidase
MDRDCAARVAGHKVAVVGGGLAGLMAARALSRQGAKVTVYEARSQVGGRILSDSTFARGRITEAGAELVGSIHTRWCALAKEYGLTLISRMNTDLYAGQQLAARLTLDRPLSMDEIRAIEHERSTKVLRPLAEMARKRITGRDESHPWTDPRLQPLDGTSVATAVKGLGVLPTGPTARLWKATQHLLVHDNVSSLEEMNLLGLLCQVKGGQTGTIGEPLMGYWDELEIYRCADGCQRLALEIAREVHAVSGCRVVRSQAVTRIDMPQAAGAWVESRNTRGRGIDRRVDAALPPVRVHYDCVVLAVPPPVWPRITITPVHPKDVIGLMRTGPATKFFTRLDRRFWIRSGFAPSGGSMDLGQVWEGTDNQTQVRGQDIVLSVFAGGPARPADADAFARGLKALFPQYPDRPKTLLVDWATQPFIEAGYASPGLNQIFTIGKELNEPFRGRMVFAGEHTQMDHFGYMEGAIRSGERAAEQVVDLACRRARPQREVLVAGGAPLPRAS